MNNDILITLRKKDGALYTCKVVFRDVKKVTKGEKITYYSIEGESIFDGFVANVEDNGEYFTLKDCDNTLYDGQYIHVSQICELVEV